MITSSLSLEDMLTVLEWRSKIPETLRTAYPLNKHMQEQYFKDVICNRSGGTRYYGFWVEGIDGHDETFLAMGGIENIQSEYRIGELSVIVNPDYRGQGWGRKVVNKILDIAFKQLNLETIFAEVYMCAAWEFWAKVGKEYGAYHTTLPKRKYWDGKYWDSLYISFDRDKHCEVKE